MTRIGSAVGVAKTVLAEARDEQITFLSAAVAYYAFVSLVPLLLLGVAVSTAVGGAGLADAVVGYLDQFLTDSGREAIHDALTNARGRTGATVVSLLLLAWSGLKLFRGLDVAFSHIYGVESTEPFLRQLFDALAVLLAIPFAFAASIVIGIVVPVFGLIPYVNVASTVTLLASLTLAFLPMYYVFPDVPMTVRAAVPGAAFAAVGWTVLAQAFRVYAANVDSFELYGLLGAALLLVTWLYFGGIVITLGGILNAVLAGRHDEDDDEKSSSSPRSASPREDADDARPEPPSEAPDIAELGAEVSALREELDAKTVSKDELEGELKQYVRSRLRRGKARGWGPYLVLLYGTVMTVGAFAYLDGGWAILGMVVVWLSTLGLYTLMVLFGLGASAVGLPGRLSDRVRSWRS